MNRSFSPFSSSFNKEQNMVPQLGSQQFRQNRSLNEASLSPDDSVEYKDIGGIKEVEEVKSIKNLIPIWVTSLPLATVLAQPSTLFTKQAITMDRSIYYKFDIPAASLEYVIGLSTILLIPMYDRIFVPMHVQNNNRNPLPENKASKNGNQNVLMHHLCTKFP